MSLETPLHKAQGMGSAHSGVGHFWKQRVTAVALIPLTVWFAISIIGLIGAPIAAVLNFLFNPVNAVLMAAFVLIALYHMVLGLQEVILDYVPHQGLRFFLMLVNYTFALALAAATIFALLRIVGT
ncbi:succinate dehydrogenase, hydrophobic membrane anchor protein [Rhizomicrobium electricum]|jgi:succinate dehydrogenase / fumarate reductase membrane anchor subunit|uniref:Succinate dehydrogenase hydrophobic membrane anchor subunit n=1 Tax=Rhizomicrobium electricum TaxID=480070 RepID=A0ABP3P0A4_9PROT|nr:succinate dehydrogenase, hydrophobic membrane anchor protein [Rhizomicrobium electricum]NIJ47264.1 succinate dehydrogenase / fumarate reductase membrane anchor subunit [Rhizomicrobium electricum]